MITETLLNCLRIDNSDIDPVRPCALDESAWEQMVPLASRLGVAPLLYHRLRSQGAEGAVPAAILEVMKEAYLCTAARNIECYRDLRELALALKAADIPVIVLKGALLTEIVYGNPGVRPMADTDLLAPFEQLERAGEILSRLGYRARRSVETEVVVQALHHLPAASKSETTRVVEMHWNITLPNQPYSVDIAEFWDRSVPVSIAGTEILALSPEDLLLHLCMHVAYMHEFAAGLRPFCDIAATIQHYGEGLAWDVIVERAVRLGWGRGVYLALRLAREWLGAGVDAAALSALMPANFDPAICEAARDQVFGDLSDAAASAPSTWFVLLWERGRLGEKARILRLRLFPDGPLLARRYGVQPGSAAFYRCYLRLWKDLILRYSHFAWKLLRSDASLSPFVQSRQVLARWMAEP